MPQSVFTTLSNPGGAAAAAAAVSYAPPGAATSAPAGQATLQHSGFYGYKLLLKVEPVVDNFMEQHHGFREYLKSKAEEYNLRGRVWRCQGSDVRVEWEGTNENANRFYDEVIDNLVNENWVSSYYDEGSWEGRTRAHYKPAAFTIEKNTSTRAVKGRYSADGYEISMASSADRPVLQSP